MTLAVALGSIDVVAGTAGDAFTCALLTGGETWCWGANTSGQLGIDTTETHYVPFAAIDFADVAVTKLAAGTAHACAILESNATGSRLS